MNLRAAARDVLHFLGGDRRIVQWRTPVRTALEHGQLTHLFSNRTDNLHPGGAGADHSNPLAGQVDGFLWPVVGVK